MAFLIKSSGESTHIIPASRRSFTHTELHGFVGGYIEVVRNLRRGFITLDGSEIEITPRHVLVVNEDGISQGLPVNPVASPLYGGFPDYYIYGDAVLCILGKEIS